MFRKTSLSPAYSAPVLETWPVRSQKPEHRMNDSTDTARIFRMKVKRIHAHLCGE